MTPLVVVSFIQSAVILLLVFMWQRAESNYARVVMKWEKALKEWPNYARVVIKWEKALKEWDSSIDIGRGWKQLYEIARRENRP